MGVSPQEVELWKSGYGLIAGVDEAGRGPLAGPVVAAAVIFPPYTQIPGVKDSKLLPPRKREEVFRMLIGKAVDWSIGIVEAETVDQVNILQATRIAMREAVEGLRIKPDFVLVDALSLELSCPSQGIIRGDSLCQCIGGASIIAKVFRDWLMERVSALFPQYEFHRHKGYPTLLHREKIKKHGKSILHRKTFSSPE